MNTATKTNTRKSTRKILHKTRIFIIELITAIAGILFAFSLCALDSASNVPIIIFIISGAWLVLFAWANDFMY